MIGATITITFIFTILTVQPSEVSKDTVLPEHSLGGPPKPLTQYGIT